MISDYVFNQTYAIIKGSKNSDHQKKRTSYIQPIIQQNDINQKDVQNQNELLSSLNQMTNITDYCQNSSNQKKGEFQQKQQIQKIDRSVFENVQILGNCNNKVIICFNEKQGMLFGLDQHAIHERIRYEYFCNQFKEAIFSQQNRNLIDPKCINLSIRNNEKQFASIFSFDKTQTNSLELDIQTLERLNKNLDKLNSYNIQIVKIQKICQSKFQVYLWPQIYVLNKHIAYDIKFIEQLLNTQNTQIPSIIDQIIMSKACKGAIKFNEELNQAQMEILLQNIKFCDFPFYCVHGRSSIHIFISLETQDISQIQKYYSL